MHLSISLSDGYTTLDVVDGYEVKSIMLGIETGLIAQTTELVTGDKYPYTRTGLLKKFSTPDLYVPCGSGMTKG